MNARTPHYTLLDHTADLALQVEGSDLRDLFENAGTALIDIMVSGTTAANPSPVEVSLSGQDLADLLVRWLGEILYLLQGESLVVTSVDLLHITAERLKAVVRSVPFDPEVHKILAEVKAVTYHQVEVKEVQGRWEARVTLDI
ncbi:MAG: archease [Deltaproteobacteria bacterium]|nr:archease [Deltaproteobacteria bacterium]